MHRNQDVYDVKMISLVFCHVQRCFGMQTQNQRWSDRCSVTANLHARMANSNFWPDTLPLACLPSYLWRAEIGAGWTRTGQRWPRRVSATTTHWKPVTQWRPLFIPKIILGWAWKASAFIAFFVKFLQSFDSSKTVVAKLCDAILWSESMEMEMLKIWMLGWRKTLLSKKKFHTDLWRL